MPTERESIEKVIRMIESLSPEENAGRLEQIQDGNLSSDKWSEAKLTFMKKYGHMK